MLKWKTPLFENYNFFKKFFVFLIRKPGYNTTWNVLESNIVVSLEVNINSRKFIDNHGHSVAPQEYIDLYSEERSFPHLSF